jgi:hypothetical protein
VFGAALLKPEFYYVFISEVYLLPLDGTVRVVNKTNINFSQKISGTNDRDVKDRLSHGVKKFRWAPKRFIYQIYFILWKIILTLTENERCSVIQVTLLFVKWHVGFNPEIVLTS